MRAKTRKTTKRTSRAGGGRIKMREVGSKCNIGDCRGTWEIATYRRIVNSELAVRVLECNGCHARAFRKVEIAGMDAQPKLAIVPASGVPTAHVCERSGIKTGVNNLQCPSCRVWVRLLVAHDKQMVCAHCAADMRAAETRMLNLTAGVH